MICHLEILHGNMDTMCVQTDGTEKTLPRRADIISDNGISVVYRGFDDWVYKRSTPFLIENEIYCFEKMLDTGFVPKAERYDKYTIRTEDLGKSDYIKDKEIFRRNMYSLYYALQRKGIRHGDLTKYSIIVKKDWPYVIDFAESRLIGDPRPDKRREGDRYWIERTIDEISPTMAR